MDPITFIGGFISAHPYVTLGAFGGYYLLSNLVGALPSPDQASGKGYKFLFTFGHGFVGGLPRIFPGLRLPSDPSRVTPTFFSTQVEDKKP